jgi:hypothetical protein
MENILNIYIEVKFGSPGYKNKKQVPANCQKGFLKAKTQSKYLKRVILFKNITCVSGG